METVYQGKERIDGSNSPQVQDEINALLDGGATDVGVDLIDTKYISSAGLRVLLSAQKKMNRQGSMVVRHSNPDIMEIFDVTGFSDILTLED